jgi:hypothetical protein
MSSLTFRVSLVLSGVTDSMFAVGAARLAVAGWATCSETVSWFACGISSV